MLDRSIAGSHPPTEPSPNPVGHVVFGDSRLPSRFWSKVAINDDGGCWEWQASLSHGYGQYAVNRQPRRAHRVSYQALIGPIPDGKVLDHLCRNRACVNPLHVEPVTIGENVMRGETITARNAAATHCRKGHPFDDDNTHIEGRRSSVRRRCRACATARARAWRDQRKAVAS